MSLCTRGTENIGGLRILTVPYYEQPMKTDLLWGYEGLTDYLGPLLAARSGLFTPEEYREYLASIAAQLGPGRPGRTWRPLRDTADAEGGTRLRMRQRLAQLAARYRLLRRRRPAMARSGDDHPSRVARQEID